MFCSLERKSGKKISENVTKTAAESVIIIIIMIIIINDNVYGAVIVTMVTARVHPVHLMNAD